MMAILSKPWNNFKDRPDTWFFYAFLLTFTLSIRKVLFFYPIKGVFNEYTGIYLYLSDIFFILTILVWAISILQNKKLKLSSYIQSFKRQDSYVLALVLVAWAALSISWSGNTNLALFKSLKLAEFGLLFLYVAYNALNKAFIRNTVWLIVALGFTQAIIGIVQTVLQHSIGLFWLKESLISVNIDGVAKVAFFGHRFIRTYGLFPHPNILGGFLLVSIVLTFAYGSMFHVKQFSLLLNRAISVVIIAIQSIALLLTFSKSAILGLFIAICFLGYRHVSRLPRRMFHMEHSYLGGTVPFFVTSVKNLWRYIVTFVIIVAVFLTILGFNINSLLFKSLNERLLYLNVSRETIVANPIVGLGMGQFVAEMQKYSSVFLANWQYQPVHNVFLLIWSELGIIGLVLFILLLWKIFRSDRNVSRLPRETKLFHMEQFNVSWGETISSYGASAEHPFRDEINIFKVILLGFMVIMLFDHYFWDIQQGQIMLWIVLGLIVG